MDSEWVMLKHMDEVCAASQVSAISIWHNKASWEMEGTREVTNSSSQSF